MSLFNAQLSNAQIAKVRDFIAKQMKKARKQFVEVNGDYHDIVIDRDVQLLVKALTDGKRSQELALDVELAKMRFTLASECNAGLATFDLLTVKTEKDLSEDEKFRMTPWLPVKRYRADGTVWMRGFCDPDLDFDDPRANRFVTAGHDTFNALRAKGLLQLMSDAEIDEFASEFVVTFDIYFQLFM